jgi:hypothetical protein
LKQLNGGQLQTAAATEAIVRKEAKSANSDAAVRGPEDARYSSELLQGLSRCTSCSHNKVLFDKMTVTWLAKKSSLRYLVLFT